MKRYLPFAIVAAVAVIAFGGGATLYRAKRTPALQLAAEDEVKTGKSTEAVHALGPANAPVTLEEFGDFQCPPCGKIAGPIRQLVKEFQPKLRMIFRQLPLPVHAHAREAALAAEAAGLQGKFWPMHELLFREQEAWSKAADAQPLFTAYAGMIGLKIDQFRKDIDGEEAKARMNADKQRAASAGATLTPTIFVNGQQITGASLSPAGIRAAIEQALNPQPTKS